MSDSQVMCPVCGSAVHAIEPATHERIRDAARALVDAVRVGDYELELASLDAALLERQELHARQKGEQKHGDPERQLPESGERDEQADQGADRKDD